METNKAVPNTSGKNINAEKAWDTDENSVSDRHRTNAPAQAKNGSNSQPIPSAMHAFVPLDFDSRIL